LDLTVICSKRIVGKYLSGTIHSFFESIKVVPRIFQLTAQNPKTAQSIAAISLWTKLSIRKEPIPGKSSHQVPCTLQHCLDQPIHHKTAKPRRGQLFKEQSRPANNTAQYRPTQHKRIQLRTFQRQTAQPRSAYTSTEEPSSEQHA
jgi:hypothetical protein